MILPVAQGKPAQGKRHDAGIRTLSYPTHVI